LRFAILIYAATTVASVTVIFAIWRGMKAHEKPASAAERIEEIIRRDRESRA
jgi:hypothetical protein